MRLEAAKKLLKEKQLSHILFSDLIDIEYLSSFRSSNAVLLISKHENLLFSDFRYENSAKSFCLKNPEWTFHLIKDQLFESISSFLPKKSVVGFQSDHLTVDNFNTLKKFAPAVTFQPVSSEISDLISIKTPKEITAMKKAATIADTAFSQLVDEIKPGITEIHLSRYLETLCHELGSERPSFETIVLFGTRAALPHGKPGTRKLKSGDWILIDFGCTVNGFCSDMTRTLIFGKASRKQVFIYQTVLNAQQEAKKNVRAGITTKEVDSIARTLISNAGFGKEFGHALGHGVGLRIHEAPRVSSKNEIVLQENMVITIEPGIYIPGFGGVRIEDMVAVRKNDCQVLTNTPRELIIL
jgi:Xaa-Pro aminopeptidase